MNEIAPIVADLKQAIALERLQVAEKLKVLDDRIVALEAGSVSAEDIADLRGLVADVSAILPDETPVAVPAAE